MDEKKHAAGVPVATARSDSEGLSLASVYGPVAGMAMQFDAAEPDLSLQNSLDALVEAKLAYVVYRLRQDWIAHMAGFWGDIQPICKVANRELDKRVATALSEGFFHFSQLLCGFEVLLLKNKELGLVSEQSVLGLEQLVVHLRDNRRDLVEIADPDSSLG